MGHSDTIWDRGGRRAARLSAAAALILAAAPAAVSQMPKVEWRTVGAGVIERGLASAAGGAVDRVWYSQDGGRLFARLRGGRVFSTDDFETWRVVTAAPIVPDVADYTAATSRPAPGVRLRAAAGQAASARLYAFGGDAVYQSDDEGRSWRNVSHNRRESILGAGFADLAVSPRDSSELVVAGADGVWRSLDGGASWAGLNEGLPNLVVRKIYQAGSRVRAGLEGGQEITWGPGQRSAWLPADADGQRREAAARNIMSASLGATVVAMAAESDFVYAGVEGGRLAASADRGRTWRWQALEPGSAVAAVFADRAEPRMALAAAGGRIYRTFNGGLFWDDLAGGGLPAPGMIRALAADVASGFIYAAGDGGLFFAEADLRGGGAAAAWSRMEGLPADAAVWDVRLDDGGNQIFVAVDGHGVFATLAPHRFREPRLVNAADRSRRAAAPGGLLSVIGAAVASARVGNVDAPVLSVHGGESQIQVPFEVGAAAGEVSLAVVMAKGRPARNMPLTLASASPAIFLDRDGAPMLLDADRGVLVEPGTALRAGSRVQILATGLGRVTPEWPTGTPAPAENTPRVAAAVRVMLDRVPVEVTRATLAPGFVGFYLIEIVVPDAVNNGPAELYVEAAGLSSGRVSVMLAQ